MALQPRPKQDSRQDVRALPVWLCIPPSIPQAPVDHQTVVCLARLESFPSVRIRAWMRGLGGQERMSSSSRQARPKRDDGPGGKLWGCRNHADFGGHTPRLAAAFAGVPARNARKGGRQGQVLGKRAGDQERQDEVRPRASHPLSQGLVQLVQRGFQLSS
jgi:hypothetical protein